MAGMSVQSKKTKTKKVVAWIIAVVLAVFWLLIAFVPFPNRRRKPRLSI